MIREKHWRVPRSWPGATVAIIASGAGATPLVAQHVRAARVRCIAVNNAFRLAPFADVLYAADAEWWTHPSNADARTFAGERISVSAVPAEFGVKLLRQTGNSGFDPDAGALRTGCNSGYQAIHLAVHFGARKIILCGYNLSGPNFHGRHVDGLRTTDEAHYGLFLSKYPTLVEPLRARGVDVVNCTPNTALKCFRVGNLENELAAVSESA